MVLSSGLWSNTLGVTILALILINGVLSQPKDGSPHSTSSLLSGEDEEIKAEVERVQQLRQHSNDRTELSSEDYKKVDEYIRGVLQGNTELKAPTIDGSADAFIKAAREIKEQVLKEQQEPRLQRGPAETMTTRQGVPKRSQSRSPWSRWFRDRTTRIVPHDESKVTISDTKYKKAEYENIKSPTLTESSHKADEALEKETKPKPRPFESVRLTPKRSQSWRSFPSRWFQGRSPEYTRRTAVAFPPHSEKDEGRQTKIVFPPRRSRSPWPTWSPNRTTVTMPSDGESEIRIGSPIPTGAPPKGTFQVVREAPKRSRAWRTLSRLLRDESPEYVTKDTIVALPEERKQTTFMYPPRKEGMSSSSPWPRWSPGGTTARMPRGESKIIIPARREEAKDERTSSPTQEILEVHREPYQYRRTRPSRGLHDRSPEKPRQINIAPDEVSRLTNIVRKKDISESSYLPIWSPGRTTLTLPHDVSKVIIPGTNQTKGLPRSPRRSGGAVTSERASLQLFAATVLVISIMYQQ